VKAGIDFSLTSPAICVGKIGEKPIIHAFKQAKKHHSEGNIILYDYPEWSTPEERFYKLALWAFKIVKDCNVINLEGYAMQGKGQVFHIGEATGLVKHLIWVAGLKHNEISPKTVKKFATGNGNADKHDMAEAFIKDNCGIDIFEHFEKELDRKKKIPSPITDMVDAYWLWKYHE
jgi:hypothetical protein